MEVLRAARLFGRSHPRFFYLYRGFARAWLIILRFFPVTRGAPNARRVLKPPPRRVVLDRRAF